MQQVYTFSLHKHRHNDSLYNGSRAEEVLKPFTPAHNPNPPKADAVPRN